MPAGRQAHAVRTNKDGSITIEYQPTAAGVHEVNLNYNDQQVEGMPFRCVVDTVGKGYVTAYGPGLNYGASGQESGFTIVGPSDVDVSIDGPSKSDITKNETKNGVTTLNFVPMSPGEYQINVKVKGKHVHGSPFSCKVSGEGRKRSQLSLTATSDVCLGSTTIDLANASATVKTPSGTTEPCLLRKLPDGRLAIASFQPKKKGTYQVEVKQEGRDVSGSPFKVDVGDGQVTNASHVRVSGATEIAKSQEWNDVDIDITSAGYGALGLSVEGPHRSDMHCKKAVDKPGHYALCFKPHEPGIYLLNIRFGDDHITGSPFIVNIAGDPSGRVRETCVQEIAAVIPAAIDSKCEFQLKIPGTDPLDMEATLTSPSGKSDNCEISDLPESLYDIKFVPWEEGIHTVSLKYKGMHISGSPFQYTVGTLTPAGTHKVEIGGTGLERGEVRMKNEFNIYTREAGPGSLSVSVEGPSKAKMEVVDRGHGYTTVSYTVDKPGEYGVHVKYNDAHVPDSPAMVYIVPDSADAKRVTIHGLRDRGLDVDKPATFHLSLNGARGNLHAHLATPSGSEEDIFLQELDRDSHAVRFIPRENGIYYVHLTLNEGHIPGSPYPMLVGQMGADPALVLAKGEGLEKGVTGKAAKFTVMTTNAGHGTLNVIIEGTSRSAIVCTEVDEGYEFCYTPMAPGDYLINIKYCNVTIAGCPSKATITGSGKPSEIKETSALSVDTVDKKPGASKAKRFFGDASKVQARGNGLKKGFMNRTNNFTLDTKDAGQAMLCVGLMSPTGNPVDELTYKKSRPTTYTVNYRCREKGEYQLVVRWGPNDVPGSPFGVSVS